MKDQIHPRYLKGFNNAYLLAQHQPKLLDSLLTTTVENEYLNGMYDGKRTYEQEQQKNQSRTRLQQLDQLHSRGDREQDQEL